MVARAHEQIVAYDVPFDAFVTGFEGHYEWIAGEVYQMSPVSDQHDEISKYLIGLLSAYLELRPIGRLKVAPFSMRLPEVNTAREPDLHVVLDASTTTIKPGYTDGPADLAVEIVSPESTTRDRGVKYEEYELSGVREYWIIDPLRREALFYVLGEDGRYTPGDVQAGQYACHVLPGLLLTVSLLWSPPYPGPIATGEAVRTMLQDDSE
ncbi:MAG: Uma2 family endonuclease [Chloroflexota bacterium]